MKISRNRYDAQFKSKVALVALRGESTIAEIASAYGVHPNMISQWKHQVLAALPGIFSGKAEKQSQNNEEVQAQLYQQIGQLKVELDWLKKKSRLIA